MSAENDIISPKSPLTKILLLSVYHINLHYKIQIKNCTYSAVEYRIPFVQVFFYIRRQSRTKVAYVWGYSSSYPKLFCEFDP